MKVWARVGIEMDINVEDIQNEQKVIEAIKAGRINGDIYFPEEADENDELYEALRAQGDNEECWTDAIDENGFGFTPQMLQNVSSFRESMHNVERLEEEEDYDAHFDASKRTLDLASSIIDTLFGKAQA